jgi:hypothetical protein
MVTTCDDRQRRWISNLIAKQAPWMQEGDARQ